MIELPAPYRLARDDDALAMAELADMAGEGLLFYLWSQMASENQAPWDIGQELARREFATGSSRKNIVREESGKVVAFLSGYSLVDTPNPVEYKDIPQMLVPLQRLRDTVTDTWYVSVLATYPKFRGKGYGSELLSFAESIVLDSAIRGLSIIISNKNTIARRLYESLGYCEQAQLPMVKEEWKHPGTHWVLLLKEI